MNKYTNIDEYISNFPKDTQILLEQFRKIVRELAPKAVEKISYAIPTFDLLGKHLVHFAGYAKHIGFYPGSEAIEVFKDALGGYVLSKGTIQFTLDKPLPIQLITKIVKYRIEKIQPSS